MKCCVFLQFALIKFDVINKCVSSNVHHKGIEKVVVSCLQPINIYHPVFMR